MTAHALDRDRELCIASGMDGFVSKPVRLELLMSELERVVYLNDRPAHPSGNPTEQSGTDAEPDLGLITEVGSMPVRARAAG
jgi:two-component system, sensor histidine kinase and response regulator